MRSYEIFAEMTPERAVELLRTLAEEAPAVFNQTVQAACAILKLRPVYLRKQPFEKRAEYVRKALARVNSNPAADELLAVYFLECRLAILTEWLDTVGLEHDEGTLQGEDPEPPKDSDLKKALKEFRKDEDSADRELLLNAFAAQDAINWPTLDTLLGQQ